MPTAHHVSEFLKRNCLLGAYHLLRIEQRTLPPEVSEWADLIVSVHTFLLVVDDASEPTFTRPLRAKPLDTVSVETDRIESVIRLHSGSRDGLATLDGARLLYAVSQMDGIRARIMLDRLRPFVRAQQVDDAAVYQIGGDNSFSIYTEAEAARRAFAAKGNSIDQLLTSLMPRYSPKSLN